MGFLAVFSLIEIGKIQRGAEYNLGFLAETRKLPFVQADKGGRNYGRTSIVNDLTHPAIALGENALAIPGSLREKHYFLGFKKLVQNLASPHIPLPAHGKSTPGAVYPALKWLGEKLFLGWCPNHLEGKPANKSPGKEYGIVGRDVVGSEKNTSGPGDTLISTDGKAVQY
jgi:hypothetical protein